MRKYIIFGLLVTIINGENFLKCIKDICPTYNYLADSNELYIEKCNIQDLSCFKEENI